MKNWQRIIIIGIISLLAAAGCAPASTPPATSTPETIVVYAPASTSSIPVILAAGKIDGVDLTLYTSQEQANALFARGEIDLLVSGLSVGVDMYRNGVPIRMVNSYVSGLSYLVGSPAANFADLKGAEVVVPFAGSPIEEVARYLAAKEGLEWGRDLTPLYSPFDTSMALLRQGKAAAVILPEPNVTLLEKQAGVKVGFSLYDLWNLYNPGDDGYPQVGAFANADWAASHGAEIAAFNAALGEAIAEVERDPEAAAGAAKESFKFPAAVLDAALGRTHYKLLAGEAMRAEVDGYYREIGKALDENDSRFYYIPEK